MTAVKFCVTYGSDFEPPRLQTISEFEYAIIAIILSDHWSLQTLLFIDPFPCLRCQSDLVMLLGDMADETIFYGDRMLINILKWITENICRPISNTAHPLSRAAVDDELGHRGSLC